MTTTTALVRQAGPLLLLLALLVALFVVLTRLVALPLVCVVVALDACADAAAYTLLPAEPTGGTPR